jgi:beta-N-acetylhexosaminidase
MRVTCGRVAVVAMISACLAGCAANPATNGSSTSQPPSAFPSTSASPSGSGPLPSASSSPAGCDEAVALAQLSIARKASLLIAAPIYQFTAARFAQVDASGVSALLILGAVSPNLPTELSALRQQLPASQRPLVLADQEGGAVTRLPIPLPSAREMAATMTPAQVHALAAAQGRAITAYGVQVDLAPVADVDARPGPSALNPDGTRSFSGNPATAATYAVAFGTGLESVGVGAVYKHFPGLGGTNSNTDVAPGQTINWAAEQRVGLPPFRAAIAAGAKAIMVANASVPGLTSLPASLSPKVITQVLRGQLGFHGLVMTDSLSAGAISQAGYSVPAASVAAVAAGADVILFGSTLTPAATAALAPDQVLAEVDAIRNALVTAVGNGTLTLTRLDAAAADVLAWRGESACQLLG